MLSCYKSQEGRVFRHHYWPRRRGQVGAHIHATGLDSNKQIEPSSHPLSASQTLLEKIKTLYNDTPGLPPDKIVPTVGQNSAHHSRSSLATSSLNVTHTHNFHPSLLIQPGRYPSPQPCSNSGISEANAGFDPFGRNTTATATQSSTSSMRSTTNASARAGKSSVCSLLPPITFEGDQPKTENCNSVDC